MTVLTILAHFTLIGLRFWPEPAHAPAGTISVTLASTSVAGGNQVTGTVTLGTPAPAGGRAVTLSTSSFAVAGFTTAGGGVTAVRQLLVPAQQTSVDFQVTTFGVAAPSEVNIGAATSTENAGIALTVTPASVASVTIAPAEVVGGTSATGAVSLNGDAPAAGVAVPLSIAAISTSLPVRPPGGPPPAAIPPTVTFGPHASHASFSVSTTPTAQRRGFTVTATLGGSASANIIVNAPSAVRLRIHPFAIFGGNSTSGTVFLNGNAPAAGMLVWLMSNDAVAVVPTSVTVAPGADQSTFSIRSHTVSSPAKATIVAAADRPTDPTNPTNIFAGAPTDLLNVFVAPRIAAVSASPATLMGGLPFALTLTLEPSSSGNNLVQLSVPPPSTSAHIVVDRPNLVTLPPTVTFPANVQQLTVNGTTTAASVEQSVVITATVERSTASTSIVVRPPTPPIASFTLRPTTVTGGQSTSGSITVTPNTAAPTAITLTSDRPDLVQMPSSVTVNPGAVQSFTVQTSAVTAQTTVTITATAGTQVVTATLTITP